MSDEPIDGTAQSIVDGVLAETRTIVDQTAERADGIVDQTLAQTEAIVDETLTQTDGIVDRTLAQTEADGTLAATRPTVEAATGGTGNPTAPQTVAARDDRAVAPQASDGAADPVHGPAKDARSGHRHDAVADPTPVSPRPHDDPTSAAPPDLPAGAPQFPDAPVAGSPSADALPAAPKPTDDAVAPVPSLDAGSFLDGIVANATDPSTLTGAGIALVVGIGATAIPRGDALAGSRLMIEIGIALAFLYMAFLSVWFWATRLRAPVAGRPRRSM